MAGLLPSEGKLRGSPANILGDTFARQICRALFFFGHRARRNFCARNFLANRSDDPRDA
jgi:hypothetical protein